MQRLGGFDWVVALALTLSLAACPIALAASVAYGEAHGVLAEVELVPSARGQSSETGGWVQAGVDGRVRGGAAELGHALSRRSLRALVGLTGFAVGFAI